MIGFVLANSVLPGHVLELGLAAGRDAVAPQEGGQEELALDHGEPCTDTGARPESERHPAVLGAAVGVLVQPALQPEPPWLREQLLVHVEGRHRDDDRGAARNPQAIVLPVARAEAVVGVTEVAPCAVPP